MYLKRQDCHIYYQLYGTGEPLLLLHGNGEDHTCFKHQIEELSSFYQVIVMDMRGHGISDIGERTLNFNLFAEDVIALLNELQIDQCHMFGFSDGGNTALTLAIHYPNRCKKIIANGANLNPAGMKPMIRFATLAQYYSAQLYSLINALEQQHKQILDLMVHHPHITWEQLETIQCPVLVLCGSKDMIKTTHSMKIAQTIPNAMLSIVPGDHFIAEKNYKVVNQQVKEFLKK